MTASADEIGVEPITIQAGVATEVWVYVDCTSYGEQTLAALNLDLQFPDGWVCGTSAKNWGDGCCWDYDFDEQGTSTNWALSGAKKTDNGTYFHYTIYATATGKNFAPTKGRLVSLQVKAPAGTPAGYYPVKTLATTYYSKDIKKDNNVTWSEAQTSYIKVGDPTEATFAPVGILPAYVNDALANATAISKLDLSAVTAVNGTFTYVDGREVVAPEADVTAAAAYKKTVTKYASLTMPFDADLTDKGAYVFNGVTGNIANFKEAESVSAGNVVLLTKDVTLEGTKLGAATKSVQSEAYYVAPDGQSLHKGINVTVPALRGYWNVGGGASNLRIALDGVLTDINMVDVQGEGADAFDLQGRRTANAKNGVFVVNGKKQFVK